VNTPPPPRSPWQLLYGAAHAVRRRYWSRRAARLPRPVVSVGNLHFGGAGKTPVVAAIAAHLRDAGWRVAILSRGYRGRGRGVRMVSVGEGPLLGPRNAGDEPVLLAGELPGVAVLVGPDRAAAGRHALQRLDPAPDLFLLDDGFSHLRLERDLDLLVFPAADPFAGGRLAPSGRLREPLRSAERADAVLLTGSAEPGDGAALAGALRPYGFRGPGFASPRVLAAPIGERGEPVGPGARVLAIAAIARPEPFFAAARTCTAVVGERAFPDHYDYPDAALRAIEQASRELAADWVLTTGKDRVKLHGRLRWPLAELPLRAAPEPAFWSWLDGRLGPPPAGTHR